MRKRGNQTSQATTPTSRGSRSGVECDWRKSRRERVAARTRGEHADSQILLSKVRKTDVGTNNPKVGDDFSYRVPVSARELDAIERYLGEEIDQLLRQRK